MWLIPYQRKIIKCTRHIDILKYVFNQLSIKIIISKNLKLCLFISSLTNRKLTMVTYWVYSFKIFHPHVLYSEHFCHNQKTFKMYSCLWNTHDHVIESTHLSHRDRSIISTWYLRIYGLKQLSKLHVFSSQMLELEFEPSNI